MLIDWFTIGAQVLNFIVLVWLLKRFLYKPILAAIDAREKRIAERAADAKAKLAAAATSAKELQQKHDEFDAARSKLLAEAIAAATVERERLLVQARNEANGLRSIQNSMLSEERDRFAIDMTHLAALEVFDTARKVLADLATASLEASVVDVFIERFKALDSAAKVPLRTAFVGSARAVKVQTRRTMPEHAQARLQTAVNEAFAADIKLEFVAQESVICGIELTANGQRLAWSVEDYLASLQQHLKLSADVAAPARLPPRTVPAALAT